MDLIFPTSSKKCENFFPDTQNSTLNSTFLISKDQILKCKNKAVAPKRNSQKISYDKMHFSISFYIFSELNLSQ